MMCYKDMTFCDGNNRKCASFDSCHRALTEAVRDGAEKAQLLIARFGDPTKLDCYKEPKTNEVLGPFRFKLGQNTDCEESS
jgi:hypothetical protein